MKSANPSLLAAALALMALGGCAHAGVTAPAPDPAAAPARIGEPTTQVVTGSRLPQRIDLSTGLPRTGSPVLIISAEQLAETGDRRLDLALRRLLP